MDPDASKSALNYLLQEVSKLAPPVHDATYTTEGRPRLSQPSGGLCQHGLPCSSPRKCTRTAKDTCRGKAGTTKERRDECYSPWRVLSLINLQCERLLYPRDVEDCDPTLVSCGIKLGHSADGSAEMGAAGTDQGVGDDGLCVECTLRRPLIWERQGMSACVNPWQDVEGADDACKPQSFDLPPQSSGQERAFVDEDAPVSLQPAQRNDSKVKFGRLGIEEQEEPVDFSTKPDVFSLPFLESDVSPKRVPDASLQLTFNASISLPRPQFTLDHNANIVVAAGPPCDAESPDSLQFGTAEGCQVLSESLDQIESQPECPPVAPLASSSDHEQSSPPLSTMVKLEPGLAEGEEEEEEEEEGEGGVRPLNHQTSSKSTWRTKTPRKQANPSRSADVQDPHFQGVTFRMDTELDDSKEQCRLLITSKYSKELSKSVRKPKMRMRTSQKCCSDEEGDPTNSMSRGKVCASCCTRKTPMWRDAEDGTPLCNACGIRYKKYRVRCVNCWHIPRKEGNSNSCCLKCGNFVQLTSTQRKHTT